MNATISATAATIARGRRALQLPRNLWHSSGRAGHGIVPFRLRIGWTERGLGAWLSFRREKVPGTAPIAPLETRA